MTQSSSGSNEAVYAITQKNVFTKDMKGLIINEVREKI